LQFSENIKAVILPPQNFTSSDRSECLVTGWGAAENLGDVPFDMRSQALKPVKIFLCENTYSILNITLPAGMTQCARDYTGSGMGPCTVKYPHFICMTQNIATNNNCRLYFLMCI
jgi:hypothetical protein